MSANEHYRQVPHDSNEVQFVTSVSLSKDEKQKVAGFSDAMSLAAIWGVPLFAIACTIFTYLIWVQVTGYTEGPRDDFVVPGVLSFFGGLGMGITIAVLANYVVKRNNLAKLVSLKIETANQEMRSVESALLKSEYKVFPREPSTKVVTARDIPSNDSLSEWADIVPSGVWLVLFLFYWGGAGYVVQTILEWLHILPLLSETRLGVVFAFVLIAGTPLFIIGAFIYLMVRLGRKQTAAKVAKLQEETNERAANDAIHEAASLTNRLHGILNDSAYCETKLEQSLEQADSFIRLSQRKYEEHKPDPFWDAIDNAAGALTDYDSLVRQLSRNYSTYYLLLESREHTFPPFPIESIPDADSAIEEFYEMVDLGQTAVPYPHFADTWSRRREGKLTRQVLIEGFGTLQEAIANLKPTIMESIAGLRCAVTSGIAQITEDEAATRKVIDEHARKQTKMLDNIQRGRKPLL